MKRLFIVCLLAITLSGCVEAGHHVAGFLLQTLPINLTGGQDGRQTEETQQADRQD